MEYIYDVVLERNDANWTARIPQVDNLTMTAATPEAAVQAVTACLKGELAMRLSSGRDVPRYERVVACMTVGVDVAPANVELDKYVSLKDAAARLGVSKSRISQMVGSGRLSSVLFHGSRLIAIESIEEYLRTPRQPGRPRKNSLALEI